MSRAKIGYARQQMNRWLKYHLVGAIGIVVQLSTLGMIILFLHVNYLVATALSVETAILHNFVWHRNFTWADRTHTTEVGCLTRFLKFNLTTGFFSLAGNLLLMRFFVGFLRVNYFIGNLLGIAICSIANFFVSDRIVFSPRTLAES